MKNAIRIFLITVLAMVMGFTMIGCPEPPPSVNLNLTGTIIINPRDNVYTGTRLIATYNGSENVTSWQWKKDGQDVGTNSCEYTPTEAGGYAVTISAAGYNSKTSAVVDVNNPGDQALSGTITIISASGFKVGTKLTARYTGTENITMYLWRKDGQPVGTNSNEYTPTETGRYAVTVKANGYRSKISAEVVVNAEVVDVPPENKPEDERWWRIYAKGDWGDPDATATMDEYSIDDDGVVTVTVGGVPEINGQNDIWNAGKISAHYNYTARAGIIYSYKFEAWTKSGTRNININYYSDDDENVYIGFYCDITTTRATYTVYGQEIPKSGEHNMSFNLADQVGTVYLKVLEIKEYEIGKLTITNFSNPGGLTQNNFLSGYVDDQNNGLFYGLVNLIWYNWGGGGSFAYDLKEINSNTLTLPVWVGNYSDHSITPYTGNDVMPEGVLIFTEWWFNPEDGFYNSSSDPYYTNKVPITFTDGNATIDFETQMKKIDE